jgi:hypothetical protein
MRAAGGRVRGGKKKAASRRGLENIRDKLHGTQPARMAVDTSCRYFFGGVLAGAAGFGVGFTGLVGVLFAAGAGTPD